MHCLLVLDMCPTQQYGKDGGSSNALMRNITYFYKTLRQKPEQTLLPDKHRK